MILANTDLKVNKLLDKLDGYEGSLGFDTEVAGPLLRGREFVNISYSTLLGLSVAFEDEECFYLPFRHKGNNISFMQLHQVCHRLQTHALARRMWAHNAAFDHQVMLREKYPMVGMLDSMVAAWLETGRNTGLGLKGLAAGLLGRQSPEYDPTIAFRSGAEVLEYACHDALNTLQIGLKLLPSLDRDWFYEECDFTFVLAKMKLQGIAIDRDILRDIRESGYEELSKLQAKWDEKAPFTSITSSTQLQEFFEDGTWESVGRTAGGKHKTGKDAMHHNVIVAGSFGSELAQLRLDYQEISKVVSTYTDGLIEESLQWADKKLHPDLHHFGTVTGRLSSTNPNIQNQPAHGEWAKAVKSAYVPDPSMEFTSADYSQVELRYFANYTGGNLLDAFLMEKDLHQVTADLVGVDRQLGKTINFGFLLYGGGARKLAGLLDVSTADAERLLARLQEGYPEIERWRQRVLEGVSQRTPIPWCRTLVGRKRYIPELNPYEWERQDPSAFWKTFYATKKKYGIDSDRRVRDAIMSRGKRLVINYLVQGGSRDLLVFGMNTYQRRIADKKYVDYSIVTTVHDEVLTQHPRGLGESARRLLKECLEGAGPRLGLRVPIVAEPKTGSSWMEVK